MRCRSRLLARKGIATLLLGGSLAGCSTWQPIRPPVGAAIPETAPEELVLVKLHDGAKLEILVSGIDADSLRGWRIVETQRHWSEKGTPRRGDAIAIARTDITAIETRQFDARLTAAGVLTGAALLAGCVYLSMQDFTLFSMR